MESFIEFDSLKKEYNNLMVERFSDAPFSESFECIYDVIEYIYECEQQGEEISDDLFDLFTFGYRYLNEKFLYMNSLLERVYKNDSNLKNHYSDLDMLFYIMDFVTDAKLEEINPAELLSLEEEVLTSIEKNIPLKDDLNKRLDDITKKIFMKGYHGFMETFEMLYDAITYGIEEKDTDDGEFFEIEK